MSGPLRPSDLSGDEPLDRVIAREGRPGSVEGLDIVRVLPTKGRRTVGPWCFVDLMGPVDAETPNPMEISPHPHIGLATVTWLLEGEALHSDSLGTEQVIRPGEVNWMSAGHGIAHAELAAKPPFSGAQMWVAQPEETRHGRSGFQHHGDLPTLDLAGSAATVFAGTLNGTGSPVRGDTPLVGADLTLTATRSVVPTDAAWEHAVIPLSGRVRVGDEVAEPGWLALVPPGLDELPLETVRPGARLLLLGGEPFERVAMWWNFVARDRDELEAAWRDWEERTDRFGPVPSRLERIDAPTPPWVRG